MHADLIELLTSRTGQDFDGECHLTEEEARDIIDALASLSSPQEPVAWQDMSTAPKDGSRFLAYTEDGGVDFFRWQDHGTCAPVGWRDSFILVYREGDEKGPRGWMPVPSTASPVVPVAAKADAEGWRPEATAPRDGTIVDLWLLNRKTGNGWRETDCSFSRGEANPYWLKNSRFITGKRYMDDDGDWCLDPGCADQESIVATHWRLPPTAPTCEGEGT